MPGALDLEPLTNLMLAVVAEKDIDVGIRVSQALFFFLSSDRIREYPTGYASIRSTTICGQLAHFFSHIPYHENLRPIFLSGPFSNGLLIPRTRFLKVKATIFVLILLIKDQVFILKNYRILFDFSI